MSRDGLATPLQPADLVLRTRLELLRTNLDSVTRLVKCIDDHRHELRTRCGPPLHRINDAIHAIDESLLQLRQVATRNPVGEDWQEVRRAANALEVARYQISNALDDTQNDVVWEVRVDDARTRELVGVADSLLGRVGAIAQYAADAATKRRVGETERANELVRKAWAEWSANKDLAKSRELFTEYVDVLGGLALRDAGFDGRLCLIADCLIRTWNFRRDWPSLTIPAREEALDATMARIIRIGFPEWTIWSLPLCAQEFGHVVFELLPDMREFVDQAPRSRRSHRRICLADAFATWVMGPAYACAALLTRFDPMRARADRSLILKRATVVLQTLQRMNEIAETDPYGPTIMRLATEWEEALRQTGCAHDTGASDGSEVDSVIECVAENVPKTFSRETWARSCQLAAQLDRQLPDDQSVRERGVGVGPSGDVCEVLNAAWCRRIDVEERGANPELVELLATNATRLGMDLASELTSQDDRVRRSGRGGSPAPERTHKPASPDRR